MPQIKAEMSAHEQKLRGLPDMVDADSIKDWLSNINTYLFKQLSAALGGRASEVEDDASLSGISSDTQTMMVLAGLKLLSRIFQEQVTTPHANLKMKTKRERLSRQHTQEPEVQTCSLRPCCSGAGLILAMQSKHMHRIGNRMLRHDYVMQRCCSGQHAWNSSGDAGRGGQESIIRRM